MFINSRLIISYIQEPEHNRYIFQLAGGEEYPASQEEFVAHWHEYRQFEKERALNCLENYRPLPVTLEIRQTLAIWPVNVDLRRKRQSA